MADTEYMFDNEGGPRFVGLFDRGDGVYSMQDLNPSTWAVNVLDYEHHEIHEGSHFTFTSVTTGVASDGTVEYLITTPNTTTWAHMLIRVDASQQTQVQFYETATHTADSTQTSYNNNRNLATDTATTTIATHASDAADGTAIYDVVIASGSGPFASGGIGRTGQEWVLKQNTVYLLMCTALAANDDISIALEWYEHANKA